MTRDINALLGVPRVWLADAVSGQTQPLFSDSQQLGYIPRWAPDGHLLAQHESKWSIPVLEVKGKGKQIPSSQMARNNIH